MGSACTTSAHRWRTAAALPFPRSSGFLAATVFTTAGTGSVCPWSPPWRPGSAGAAAAAAGLTRPQAFAFAPVLMWWVWRRSSWPGLWRTTAALAAGAVATCAYNAARFGAPFNFGYSAEMFSTPFLVGTGGLLFHPAKSIFLFAPIALALVPALVRLARKDSAAFWLISWNLSVAFSMAATW